MSKMDKDYYVELSVIADFHLVKVLTRNEADQKLIIEAVKFSKKVCTHPFRPPSSLLQSAAACLFGITHTNDYNHAGRD